MRNATQERLMKRFVLAALLGAALSVRAETPQQILAGYEAQAKQQAPGFAGFSAARGEQFFSARHGAEWSCASCHGAPPVGQGRHAKTGKVIAALAPIAGSQRFTDAAKAEKWFKRNCSDVLSRPCTAQEKGDVLAYLLRAAR
jgi:cytochrome c